MLSLFIRENQFFGLKYGALLTLSSMISQIFQHILRPTNMGFKKICLVSLENVVKWSHSWLLKGEKNVLLKYQSYFQPWKYIWQLSFWIDLAIYYPLVWIEFVFSIWKTSIWFIHQLFRALNAIVHKFEAHPVNMQHRQNCWKAHNSCSTTVNLRPEGHIMGSIAA